MKWHASNTQTSRVNILKKNQGRWSLVKGLLHKRDWPEYVDAIGKIYESDELKTLFAACLEHERARYPFFLLTGERDKEVRFTAWRDIDFRRGTVRVTAKPPLGFMPKNKEEREIPVPSALLGHKDLASTMVYLKYVRGKDVQERLDNSELAGFAILQALKQSSQEIDRPSRA